MRVLRIFFTAIVIFLVIGLIGGFIAREVLLMMALQQLRGDLKRLPSFPLSQKISQECLEYSGGSSQGGSVIRYQLRFISDRQYVLEGVCEISESLRTVFETKSLPILVRREVSQSGIIEGQNLHGLEVSIFGRLGTVYEEDNFFWTSYRSEEEKGVITSEGPATVCGGYGYECCDKTYQTGLGEQRTEALDCPRSCFPGCTQKPVVLTFNADPFDPGTRTVFLRSGDPVEFLYTITDVKGDVFSQENLTSEQVSLRWDDTFLQILEKYATKKDPVDSIEKVVVTFGDGAFQDLESLQGSVSHTYTCTGKAFCEYTATVQGVTQKGITSDLEGLAKIRVLVE